jgi:pentapeptide repeat protein
MTEPAEAVEAAEAQDFDGVRMRGSTFHEVDLSGARFHGGYLTDTDLRDVMFGRVRMRGVELMDVAITGEISNLTINGVDVAPLVTAELERRHPELATMRPTDPAVLNEEWWHRMFVERDFDALRGRPDAVVSDG